MSKVLRDIDASEILLLGDNFYYDGVTNVSSTRFKDTFDSVYSKDIFGDDIPFYVIAGNHDHHQNVTAQILYSDLNSRWNFPDYYYSRNWTWVAADGTERRAELHLVDTVVLCGQSEIRDEKTGKIVKEVRDRDLTHARANTHTHTHTHP